MEKGEVLPRGVGTLWYFWILGENSACRVPICAAAARWADNPRQKVVPRGQIPRSTFHFSQFLGASKRGSGKGDVTNCDFPRCNLDGLTPFRCTTSNKTNPYNPLCRNSFFAARKSQSPGMPASVRNTSFTRALARESSSRNCSPASDFVFLKPIFLPVFLSGGVVFHGHR